MTDSDREKDDRPRWVQVDAWGNDLAGRQGAHDVEVGDWLIAAREEQVHDRLGLGSYLEYVEKRLGLDGHSTAERLRVAERLRNLPELREALRRGERSWSTVRELSRVAVPETEGHWLEASRDRRVHEVERMVAGRRPGQVPGDPADPRLERHVLRFEVTAETYALFREAVRVMQRDVDPHVTEEEALAEMARRILGGPGDDGRAVYQVALTQCEDCGRAWQQARGELVEVAPEVMEMANCDGQHIGHIGHIDGSASSSHVGPRRASQTIPPAMRREVMRRDHGRCRVPGCTNSTFLHVHHLHLRSEGGDHDPSQMAVLCGLHHQRLHAGLLIADGEDAINVRFFHADGTEYGAVPDAEAVDLHSKVFSALRNMGFRETETKRALAEARSHVGPGATLEEILRAALRAATDTRGRTTSTRSGAGLAAC